MLVSLERDEFKCFMDNTTRWLRIALLLSFKLGDLGHKEEAGRILTLSKQEVTDELREYEQRR
jgi:hypothetical protein